MSYDTRVSKLFIPNNKIDAICPYENQHFSNNQIKKKVKTNKNNSKQYMKYYVKICWQQAKIEKNMHN